MSDHIAVEVRVNGESILCLETGSLTGVENIRDYDKHLRDCIEMLQGFVGPENPAPFIEEDPYETEDYQKFVADMSKHCRCQPPHDSPCAGVLAGGPCDELGVNEPPDEFDDDEELDAEEESP